MTATPARPVVQIAVDAMHSRMAPTPWSIVEPVFEYETTRFALTAAGRVTHARVACRLVEEDDAESGRLGGEMEFPTYLVPDVVAALQAAGRRVELQDVRPHRLPQYRPDPAVVNWLRLINPALAVALIDQFGGIVVAPSEEARIATMALLCRLYPVARVLIPCVTHREAVATSAALSAELGGHVPALYRDAPGGPQIACTTLPAFEQTSRADWDLLIFPDADRASTSQTRTQRWHQFASRRSYGFVASARSLSPARRQLLGLLAGPVLYDLAPPPPPRDPVTVAFATLPPVATPRELDALGRRRAVWEDARRNATLAGLARGFADRDAAAIWERGLLLDDPALAARWTMPPTVLLLTDSPEHTRRLAALLPGWLDRDASTTEVPPSRGIDFDPPGRLRIECATSADRDARGWTPQIVILAAGGPAPALPRGFPPRTGGVAVPRLVVDAAETGDGGDDADSRATRSRLAEYRERGFAVAPGSGAASRREARPESPRAPGADRRRRRRKPRRGGGPQGRPAIAANRTEH